MKKILSKTPLPRHWKTICPEALSLWDISFAGCSIHTKLLLFRTAKDAGRFTRRQFGYRWGHRCRGLFHELSQDVYGWKNGKPYHHHEYDPRYIGFICLLEKHLTMEIISHECCHAAFTYSRRLKKNWPDVGHNPDEAVCYPVGKLVAQVCSALKESGFTIKPH